MALYGVRANNSEIVKCHWCGKLVVAGEATVEVGILGFYGHRRCYLKAKR